MRRDATWSSGVGPGPVARLAGWARVTALFLAVGLTGCGGARTAATTTAPQPLAFEVLRAAPSRADAPTPMVARYLLSAQGLALSAGELQNTRRVLSTQEGWLVPTQDHRLCLVRVVYPLVPRSNGERLPPSVSQTCASKAEAMHGRLLETQSLSTTFVKRMPTRVDGIVPDGVHRVTVRSSGGASRTVPAVHNAYEAIVVNPRSVSFVAEQAGRRRRYVIPTPSAAGGRPYALPSHREHPAERQE